MTSRRSMLLSLVLGAFLSAVGLNVAYSQVPRSISYQGLLVKNNQPVNALVNLHIKITDAAGQMLYQESYNQVQISNGIFSILLGGNSGTLPASLKFDEQYFLEVEVDNTGPLPKTPFVAAPYALNAQTVGGVGVSVTPQAGMLLPLDQNGKLPKSVLPTSTQALTTINGMAGDGSGNVRIVTGNPATLLVTDNVGANTITLTAMGGGSGIQTVVAGPGLTGGGSAPGQTSVTLQIANNGITNAMLGTSVVRGINLDQNIPQLGLYQDVLGQLNVGKDSTLRYVFTGQNPIGVNHGIGLNLSNPNTWLGLQTFNGGLTTNGTTTLNGPVIITGTTTQTGNYTLNGNMVVNGTPEPLAAPNAATYEITDNGDLKVTGSSYLVGNTYIGAATNGGTNTMGTAGQSTNTITGTTNTTTGTVANNSQAPTVNVGTSQVAGNAVNIGTLFASTNTISGITNTIHGATNNIGASGLNPNNANNIGSIGGNSTNTIAGGTNTMTAATSNDIQSPTNRIGTTNANSANTIGNAGTSTNTITGLSNNIQGQTNNVGTTQTAGGVNNIGTAGISTNTITGANNTITATGTTTTNGNVVHNGVGEPNAANDASVTNYELISNGDFRELGAASFRGNVFMNQTLAVAGASTLTGLTNNGTFIENGNSTFNGNITQTSGTTTLLGTTTGALTVVGAFTQSGGNAAIAGGAVNSFGTVGGSANTIGGAASTNTYNGSNTFNGNIVQTAGTTTLLATTTGNLQVNGTLGSTGNITLGTSSSNNTIGAPGAINTFTGATNNLNATTANNVTGDLIQISGRSALAPTASTINSFGTGASQINSFSTGNGTTTTIGNGSGNVNNIGTSVAGTSTNNIGNLNAGTTNNINGLSTFTYTGDQTYVRIAGGVASCVGAFPTGAQSELLVNGDGFFDGTLAACRLNIFGAGASCITNLNTVNFGSCGGAGVPINLISSLNGVPTGAGATDITNMRNIQAQNSVQTNTTLTIGTTGTNATNITSSNPGPAAVNQQTPTVSGKLPTYQTYQLDLTPGTGPNGGGAATFNAATTAGLINFDINDGLMVTYRTHNLAVPVGALYVTSVPGVSVTVESSAANDNNRVQLTILRD